MLPHRLCETIVDTEGDNPPYKQQAHGCTSALPEEDMIVQHDCCTTDKIRLDKHARIPCLEAV